MFERSTPIPGPGAALARGRATDAPAPHSYPSGAAIVGFRPSSDPQAPDFIEPLIASTPKRRPRRPGVVDSFEAVVTFESASGMAEPVEVRSRLERLEVDDACRRAVLRALPAASRIVWASVVVVLTRAAVAPEAGCRA
jgi:hypothetical protein